jgi:Tol biopolymer transport system component
MTIRSLWLVAALASALTVGTAAQTTSAKTAMEAARKTEVVDGDLRAAIKQYAAIADKFKADRGIAADALLRMAECYQKLGDAQARETYQRLIRDFGDQKEAVAVARMRLGGGGSTAVAVAKGDRAVWTGRDVDLFGTVSPDGRYLTYVDWGGLENVMLRDLVGGTSRPLTNNTTVGEFGLGEWSAISRDGEQVAYEWIGLDRKDELRIAPLHGPGVPAFRRIRQVDPGESVRPFDWSPDGKWLAVLIERTDRSSQVGIMSVQDGSLRPLKSIDWRGVNKMVFSPDGRFIAYDIIDGEARDRARIYVMAVDASREVAVVDDASRNNVMGWAPDGRLVFASDRTGTRSLWTVRVEDGRAKGEPRLAKENVGSTWSLGLTPTGTLYVWQPASTTYVRVAPFEFASGRLIDSGGATFQRFIESRGRPSWSADARHLVYISCGTAGGGPCTLFVHSTETGGVRQIPHALGYLAFPRLAPDAHAIVTNGRDLKGRDGIYLIDAATGQTSLITAFVNPTQSRNPEWSSDGRAILYLEDHDRNTVLLRRDIASSEITEVFRTDGRTAGSAAVGRIRGMRLSPDGRLVGLVREDPDRKVSTFVVMPLSGGAPRVLLETSPSSLSGMYFQWMPDSSGVTIEKGGPSTAEAAIEVWHLPLNAPARKLDIDARFWGEGFSVRPDGRQIAFAAQAGAPGAEVWALENFLPAQASTRQSAGK